MRKIENNLKSILAKKGIPLNKLAKDTNLTCSSLSKFANYRTKSITFEYLETICNYLNIELDELMELEKKRVNDFENLKIA